MKRTWKILLAAVVVQGLAACAQQGGAAGGPGGTDASILTAYHWRLQQALNATGAPQPDAVNTHGGQALQLTFAGERVAVAGLCNTLAAVTASMARGWPSRRWSAPCACAPTRP